MELYTPELVRRVADVASKVSGGVLRMAEPQPEGLAGLLAYRDATDPTLLWSGLTGARRAAHFYARAALVWLLATAPEREQIEGEWPEPVQRIAVDLRSDEPEVRKAGLAGAHHAFDLLAASVRPDLGRVAAEADQNGVAAVDALHEHFEYESCSECLTDLYGHAMGLDMFGNWHVWCVTRPPVVHVVTADGVQHYLRIGSVTRVSDYDGHWRGEAWAARSIHQQPGGALGVEHVQMYRDEAEADRWVRQQHELFLGTD